MEGRGGRQPVLQSGGGLQGRLEGGMVSNILCSSSSSCASAPLLCLPASPLLSDPQHSTAHRAGKAGDGCCRVGQQQS